MLEGIKSMIARMFGFSTKSFEVMLLYCTEKIKPTLLLIARVLFIVGFLYCLYKDTIAGIYIGILGFYLMELENKVEDLESRLRDNDFNSYQQRDSWTR